MEQDGEQTRYVSPNPTRVAQLHRIGTVSSVLAAVIGTFAMAGWIFGVDELKSVIPGLIMMKANTALCFIVLGAGLYLLRLPTETRQRFALPAGAAAALFVLALSGLVFSQYLHRHDLGVDQFLFDEPAGAVGTIDPGRMALNTSVCFVLAATGALIARSRFGPVLSPVIGLLIFGAGLLALVGYATGVTSLYGLPEVTQMAVPTASGFILLGIALITFRPDTGPLRLLSSDGPGGALVRRVLPAGVAGIIVLAILRLAGQDAGLYGTQVGAWLLVSAVIALLIPLVWRVAGSLERSDAERAALARDREAILNSAGNGIFHVDREGRTTFINPAAAQMLGWAEEELVGQRMHVMTHHTRADGTPYPIDDCPIYAAFKDGQIHHRSDEVFWRRDGTSFEVEYTSAPVRENGRVAGASVVFSDISVRCAAERELADKRAELERSNEELKQFAYIASHDLNEPLRTIAGFAQLLERRYEDQVDDRGRDYIRRMVGGVDRMQTLIGDLLRFSRAGHVDAPPEPVDTAVVAAEVLEDLRERIAERQAEVSIDGLPEIVAHRNQLQQLFQNLIANALKFTNGGTPRVEVSAQREDGAWRFSVADNGIGIDPEQRDRIFGAFARLHSRDEYGGTGIGLAICKKIVERHGGEIHVEDGIDGGSRFTFTVPTDTGEQR